MSLLQLLTSGRSLVGLGDDQPRYRVTNERLLPEFGSARNPFTATDRPGPARVDSVRREASAIPGVETQTAKLTAPPASDVPAARHEPELFGKPPHPFPLPLGGGEGARRAGEGLAHAPNAAPPAVEAREAAAPKVQSPTVRLKCPADAGKSQSRVAAWGGRWLSKLAALFSRPSSTPGKLKLPGSLRGQVQGELALDRIKVVRNDLSDADLEVVPARLPISRVAIKPAWSGTDSRASASRGRRAGLARTDKS